MALVLLRVCEAVAYQWLFLWIHDYCFQQRRHNIHMAFKEVA
jgi:hypothetical protein